MPTFDKEKRELKTNLFGHVVKIGKYWTTGLIGAVFNFLLLLLLREVFELYFFIAGFIGIEAAIALVFFLNDRWTWKDRDYGKYFIRFLKFNFASAPTAFLINYPVFLMLIYLFGINYLLASLFGFVLAGFVNFIINHKLTWGVYHDKKIGWIRTIGWVLFGFIALILVCGFLIFNVPSVQKYVVNVVIQSLSIPIEIQYGELSFSYGSINLTNLDMKVDRFEIQAEKVSTTLPAIATMRIRKARIIGLQLKMLESEKDDEPEEPSGIKIPVRIDDLEIYNSKLDFGDFKIADLTLKGELEKDGIILDTCGAELIGRGRIVDLTGEIIFDEDNPAISWDAKVDLLSSMVRSKGSILLSPLDFQFRAWGDSIVLSEIDSLIGMGVLTGIGDADISLTGSPRDTLVMDIQFDGELFDIPIDTAKTRLTFINEEQLLVFENMQGSVMKTALRGNGTIMTSYEPARYTVDADVFGLNIENIIEGSGIESSFTGRVLAEGSGFEPEEMDLSFNAVLQKSSFWGIDFDSADAAIRLTADSLYFNPMITVYRGGNIIDIAGNFAYDYDMNLDIDGQLENIANLMQIAGLEDMIGGSGKAEARFTGKTINPSIEGTFQIDSLDAAILTADSLTGDFQLSNLTDLAMGAVNLHTKGKLWGFDIDSIRSRILINGNMARISPIEIFRENLYLYGISEVEFEDDLIVVSIDGIQAQYDSMAINLNQASNIYFSDDLIFSDSLFMAVGAGLFKVESFVMDSTEIEVIGSFDDILAQNIMQQFDMDLPLTASFDGEYYFSMPGSLLTESYAVCSLRTDNITVNGVPWENGNGVIELSDGIINIPDLRFFKQDEFYEINGQIEPFKDDPEMDVWLEGLATSSNILQAFSEQIDSANTGFEFRLRLFGEMTNPDLHGVLELSDGYIKLYELQQPIEGLYISARLNNNKIHLDSLSGMSRVQRTAREKGVLGAIANAIGAGWKKLFGGGIRSNGYFGGKGKISIEDMSNPIIDMDIWSNYFPINLHNRGIYLIVNSEISVEGPMSDPSITSDSIKIIEGTILGLGSTSGGSGTGEIPADLSVRIEIPGNFWIFTDQAEIEVAGDVVVGTSQNMPYFQGNLRTESGQYFTFGKTFEIQEGNLNFTQASEINPELNITATTAISEQGEAVRIYLYITGNLRNPQLNLSAGEGSNLSHGDLILLLTMHRTTGDQFMADSTRNVLDQLEGKGTDILREYQYYEVSKVAKDIIGVEQFEIVPMDNQNIWEGGDYQFIVGKYITPKLYLKYSQNIGTGVSEELGDIEVEYQLTNYLKLIGGRNYENPQKPETYKLELDFEWKF
ncbi:MAG: translocation/assembly module TamB domain-containing protein [Candidatus Zixiibacteriota bacterium]